MQPTTFNRSDTLGLVLAGGQGRRMGGRDKAWLSLAGKPLVCHAIEHLAPQVGQVVVSANRHRWAYRRLGIEVVGDHHDWRGRGPLAAIASAFTARRPSRLAVVPVDVPFAPLDHIARLAERLDAGEPAAAIHDGRRRQPLFCLLSAETAVAARSAVSGEPVPSMRDWLDHIGAVWIAYAEPARFGNVNTPDDLQLLKESA
jgi:molybdopterin-guanine dinucleotide biosynthesis protein A